MRLAAGALHRPTLVSKELSVIPLSPALGSSRREICSPSFRLPGCSGHFFCKKSCLQAFYVKSFAERCVWPRLP
jgi:hypothetical protein